MSLKEVTSTEKSSSMRGIIHMTTSLIGFLLFAMFSSLQRNDVGQYGTDQWLTYGWVISYGILAFLCLINAIHPLSPRIFLTLASVTLALAIFRGSQIDWSQPLFCFTAPEEFAKRNPAGNETGGLIIMTLWLMLVWWTNRYKSKNTSSLRTG